jgi:hypothetical protein
MADESFPVSLDLGNLPQDVTDIKTAVGTPAAGTTLAGAVGTPPAGSSIAGILGTPAAGRALADTIGAPPAGSSIAGILGTPAAGGTLADAIGTPPAGHSIADILLELRWLVLKLWWLDHICWYFFHQRAETAVGVACHHAGLGDAARRDSVTGEELSRVADQHHLPHPQPPELEDVLRTAKAFAAHLPTPPTTAPRSARP